MLVRFSHGLMYDLIRAFEGCSELTTVNLPANIKYIGYNSFWESSELVNLSIPSSFAFRFDVTAGDAANDASITFNDRKNYRLKPASGS